jgi:glutamyl-Q tRNA(Asp) synthetase
MRIKQMTHLEQLFQNIKPSDLDDVREYYEQHRHSNKWNNQVVRFAPSPTGLLHLGNIYSALYTHHISTKLNARTLLRIEDIDPHRCRDEYEAQIYKDMARIGYDYEEPVMRQSQRLAFYQNKIEELYNKDLVYPCFCSRKNIREELERKKSNDEAIIVGADGPHYTGTCRDLSKEKQTERIAKGDDYNMRLNVKAAFKWLETQSTLYESNLTWLDRSKGIQSVDPEQLDDVVLARKDCGTVQGITVVTRGEDLYESTHIHRLLQELWALPVPFYDHHDLLCEPDINDPKNIKKMSKQSKSKPFKEFETDEVWTELSKLSDR